MDAFSSRCVCRRERTTVLILTLRFSVKLNLLPDLFRGIITRCPFAPLKFDPIMAILILHRVNPVQYFPPSGRGLEVFFIYLAIFWGLAVFRVFCKRHVLCVTCRSLIDASQ